MGLHHFALLLERLPDKRRAAALVAEHQDIYLNPDQREVTVQREAGTLAEAVASAIRDLEAADLPPIRVYDGDWVTLAHIGERVGRSREAVRLWAIGKQGPGGFPPPLNPGRETKFYSWTEVSAWIRRHTVLDVPLHEPDLVVANLLLQARRLAPRVRDGEVLSALLDLHLQPAGLR
ncbi:hypothetical protein RB614_00880 [Phytohabitans sp. ZYX-F-186]|uniref:DNA-binding protein n=1 Tax=Phytohabitans maris TaxID=3071409 RepID=A0ABU0Z7P4_9ACTN|nr:hypothetical protein [Phytohabitans sp. ZYX-F-186]MDQ7903074.1 hypothetical protein [Phytohabitans sp. ZYX-F-186]